MDGHPGSPPLIGAGSRTESRLQAGSPSLCLLNYGIWVPQTGQNTYALLTGSAIVVAKRANGDGSITWLSTTKVLLRVTVEGNQRSKTVMVKHQKHGGKGEAEAALEAFKVEVRTPRRQSPSGRSAPWSRTTPPAGSASARRAPLSTRIASSAGGLLTTSAPSHWTRSPPTTSMPSTGISLLGISSRPRSATPTPSS